MAEMQPLTPRPCRQKSWRSFIGASRNRCDIAEVVGIAGLRMLTSGVGTYRNNQCRFENIAAASCGGSRHFAWARLRTSAVAGSRFSRKRVLNHLTLLTMRGVSTVAKFLLAIYTARYLGLSDLGIYGLLTGATNIVPAITGLGMTPWVTRKNRRLAACRGVAPDLGPTWSHPLDPPGSAAARVRDRHSARRAHSAAHCRAVRRDPAAR